MKTLLIKLFSLCLLMIAYIPSTFSQIDKHTTQIGITGLPIFDLFNSVPDNKISGIGLNASLGYFPTKNLAIGFQLIHANVRNEYNDFNNFDPQFVTYYKDNIKYYGINPFLKYYVKCSNRFYIYPMITGGVGVLRNKNKEIKYSYGNWIPANPESRIQPSFNIAAGIGFNYFITDKFALDLSLPFTHLELYSQNYSTDFTSLNTIVPFIGIRFFLNREPQD